MMSNTIIFGVFLGIIMVIGSIPLGFSEPILQQWEETQDFSQLNCNNSNHVLVMRGNGNPACVSEKTASKMGWQIINSTPIKESLIINSKTSINNHNKDYVKNLAILESETTDENGSSAPSYYSSGWSKAEISKIPKLGDVFDITVTAQADPPDAQSHHITFSVTEQFEFVKESLPENVSVSDPIAPYFDRWGVDIFIDEVETANVTVQVKAIKEGYGFVYGGAPYEDASGNDGFIYVDRDNSFYYDDDEEPTVNHPPGPDYGITYEESKKLEAIHFKGQNFSSSDSPESLFPIINSFEKAKRELALSKINLADHIDDKSYYSIMPKAENVKTTVLTPESIPVGSTEIVTVTLESINRVNDYEQVLIDLKVGPGIELDAQKVDKINCYYGNSCEPVDDIYNNDIFAIGEDNITIIEYPIKATKPGTWMLNFVVNGEFERYSVLVE